MRELGVGLIWWPALASLCETPGVVDVVELEPQSQWEKLARDDGWRYERNDVDLARVAALPQPKLLHGIGQPVGGSVVDPVPHLDLLRDTVDRLDPVWVSEHLSFNRVPRGEAGFLLPPRQSPAGARVAADRVRAYGEALGRPVAFETGVNYFAPRTEEMADGAFFAEVAEQGDSGILLDLHNLWCNERNGRSRVEDVLDRLPLDRVWELHLAGGEEFAGVHLDSHRGGIDPELLELAAAVVPRLPQLGALIFEVLPEHVDELGLDGVAAQLDALRDLWNLRSRAPRSVHVPGTGGSVASAADVVEVAAWEDAVVAAVRGTQLSGAFAAVSNDPAAAVYRELVDDFRRAALARCLRFTTTALLLGLGSEATGVLLDACHTATVPDAFPAVAAETVARELWRRRDTWGHLPFVADVLSFEHALLRAVLFGESTEVGWSSSPDDVLGALAGGRWPAAVRSVSTRVTVGG